LRHFTKGWDGTMQVNDVLAQIDGSIKSQERLIKLFSSFYREEARCKVAVDRAELNFEHEKDALSRAHRSRSLAMMGEAEYQQASEQPDDVRQMILDHMLQDDVDFSAAIGKYYQAQEALLDAKAELVQASSEARSLAEEIGILRSRLAVLAAVLNYLSGVDRD